MKELRNTIGELIGYDGDVGLLYEETLETVGHIIYDCEALSSKRQLNSLIEPAEDL